MSKKLVIGVVIAVLLLLAVFYFYNQSSAPVSENGLGSADVGQVDELDQLGNDFMVENEEAALSGEEDVLLEEAVE